MKKVCTKKFLESTMKGYDKNNLNRLLCFFSENAKKDFENARENGQFIFVESLVPNGKYEEIVHFFVWHNPENAKKNPLDKMLQEQLAPFVENPKEWCDSGGFGVDLVIFREEDFLPLDEEFWKYCKLVSRAM